MGHEIRGLFGAKMHEYENDARRESYLTSPINLLQLCVFGKQCNNIAKLSQGTGMRFLGLGAYIVSYPDTCKGWYGR